MMKEMYTMIMFSKSNWKHIKSDDMSVYSPNHTCIIKATMEYKEKRRGYISFTMQNRMYDECGDSDIVN